MKCLSLFRFSLYLLSPNQNINFELFKNIVDVIHVTLCLVCTVDVYHVGKQMFGKTLVFHTFNVNSPAHLIYHNYGLYTTEIHKRIILV